MTGPTDSCMNLLRLVTSYFQTRTRPRADGIRFLSLQSGLASPLVSPLMVRHWNLSLFRALHGRLRCTRCLLCLNSIVTRHICQWGYVSSVMSRRQGFQNSSVFGYNSLPWIIRNKRTLCLSVGSLKVYSAESSLVHKGWGGLARA